MTREEQQQRRIAMQKMFNSGMTLTDIGKEFGLTKERVRQIIPHAVKTRLYWKQWEKFVAKEIGTSIGNFCFFVTRHGKVGTYANSRYSCRCKRCTEANTTRVRKYREENREKINAYHRSRNKDPRVAKSNAESAKKWRLKNKDRYNKSRREYYRMKVLTDPEFVLKCREASRRTYRRKKELREQNGD